MIKIETETKILSLFFGAAWKMSRVLYKGPWHWQRQWSGSCARAHGRMEEFYEKLCAYQQLFATQSTTFINKLWGSSHEEK
jgi:hypothetical protein